MDSGATRLIEGTDRFAVAGRLRALLAWELRDIPNCAHNLKVDELGLRLSIDEVSPHPTLEVLVAVITRYRVDPAYLVTGEYDRGMHLKILDAEVPVAEEVVRKYLLHKQVERLQGLQPPISDAEIPPQRQPISDEPRDLPG